MINLGRFSGTILAAALLLCAFPVATGGQDKNAPSNVEKNTPSNVVIEERFEKLRFDFLKSKQELEERLDAINRRLDSIDSLLGQVSVRRGSVDESSVLPSASGALRALSDGRSDYSDLESCCRHINYHVPCCEYVYHHEPCCRHAYHREPCCRHVYHPRRIYPQPFCRYAYRELD
jgi:hypothetical protein